jgi:hypothetical protein
MRYPATDNLHLDTYASISTTSASSGEPLLGQKLAAHRSRFEPTMSIIRRAILVANLRLFHSYDLENWTAIPGCVGHIHVFQWRIAARVLVALILVRMRSSKSRLDTATTAQSLTRWTSPSSQARASIRVRQGGARARFASRHGPGITVSHLDKDGRTGEDRGAPRLDRATRTNRPDPRTLILGLKVLTRRAKPTKCVLRTGARVCPSNCR